MFLNDYGKGGAEYNYLTKPSAKESEEKHPSHWLIQLVLVSNLLLLIFTQARIEMFKKQTNQNEPIINLNRQPINRRIRKPKNKHSVLGNKFVAITIALLVIFIMVNLEFLLFSDNIKSLAKALRTRVITSIIVHILVPFLWMRKKKKVRDFFFRMLSSDQRPSAPVPRLKLVSMRTNRVSPMV